MHFYPSLSKILPKSKIKQDKASGRVLCTFTGDGARVSSVAFSGDGRSVLLATDACAAWIALHATQEGQAHTRVFVLGRYAPSTALFDVNGSLIDCDNEAADTWLMHLGQGTPQPLEAAFAAQPSTP